MLQLQRSDGLALEVPPPAPGVCETCRKPSGAQARDGCYCSGLCALFDAALAALVAALERAEGDRFGPDVVSARTWLRAVALEYDAAMLPPDERRRRGPGGDDWTDDVAAGLLTPVRASVLRAEVRRRAGIG